MVFTEITGVVYEFPDISLFGGVASSYQSIRIPGLLLVVTIVTLPGPQVKNELPKGAGGEGISTASATTSRRLALVQVEAGL